MPNDIFRNRCSAERHFPESSFSRTSFLRIVVQPNVVFPKHHLPERHFAGISRSKTSFHRTLNRPPAYTFVQCACRITYHSPETVSPNDQSPENLLERQIPQMTNPSNKKSSYSENIIRFFCLKIFITSIAAAEIKISRISKFLMK